MYHDEAKIFKFKKAFWAFFRDIRSFLNRKYYCKLGFATYNILYTVQSIYYVYIQIYSDTVKSGPLFFIYMTNALFYLSQSQE
jgi:hypothetical protein